MKNRQIYFFAEQDDIEQPIRTLEACVNICYYETGLFDTEVTPSYSSLFNIKGLDQSIVGDWTQSKTYLIIPEDSKVAIRKVPQRRGGTKYAIDQLENPQSVVIKPGGVFKDGILIAGSFGTVSKSEFSEKMFKMLSKNIKSTFTKIGQFYVGKNAKLRLLSGWRLTTNEKSPLEYDLQLE